MHLEIFVVLYSLYQTLSPLHFFNYDFTANENCPADRPTTCSASPTNTGWQTWKSLHSASSLYVETIMQSDQPLKEGGAQGLKPMEFFISFVQLDCHLTSVLRAGGCSGIQESRTTQPLPDSFKWSHSALRRHAFVRLQHSAWAQILIWSFKWTCPGCACLWGFGCTGFFWDYSSVRNIWWSSPLHADLLEIKE